MVVNRWWELVEANSGIAIFTNHTVEELAIESFYPADDRTAAALTPSTC